MSRFNINFIRTRRILMILMLVSFVWSLFASSALLPLEQPYKVMRERQAVTNKEKYELASADADDWQAYMNPYNFSAMVEDGAKIWFASPMGILQYDRNSGSSRVINTANSGLNSNYVSSMLKHSSGDIWFSHTVLAEDSQACGGLSILHPDGSWSTLTYQDAPFHSNNITSLGEDATGKVWIGYAMNGYSEGGVSCYDPTSGQWQYYNKHNSVMPSNTVMSFFLASDNSFWITLSGDVDPDPYEGGGLVRIVGDQWEAFTTQIADDPTEPLKEWYIKNMVEDSQGNLWFALSGSVDTGLYMYDGVSFTRYEAPFDAMYWDLAVDSDDTIYVNGITSKVMSFDGVEWLSLPDPGSVVDGFYIQNVWVDSQDRVWVAKYDDYLVAYENGAYITPDLNLSTPIKGLNSFWCMDSDNNGNTYFGTGWYVWGSLPTTSSLLQWDETDWYSYNYQDYQNYVVNDVAWDMQGNLLIATGDSNDNAAVIFDMYGSVCRKTESGWIKYDGPNTGYPFIYAKLAQEDYNGYIWAGTNNMGLAVYDGVEWTVYNNDNITNFSVCIGDILASHTEPVVWVACTTGLFKVDISNPDNYVWEHLHPLNSELPAWNVNSLDFASDGSLLVGTDYGLAVYSDGVLSEVTALEDAWVIDLDLDEYDGIWLATGDAGLLYYRDGMLSSYTRENSPLPTNHTRSVCSDKNGTLWIHPYNNGLYRMEYGATANDDSSLPLPMMQVQNYPNPFNPDTVISFDLPVSGLTEIGIYNLKGQLVKSYPASSFETGNHQVHWDGMSDNGASCSSGIYFVRVQCQDIVQTHKMTLMK